MLRIWKETWLVTLGLYHKTYGFVNVLFQSWFPLKQSSSLPIFWKHYWCIMHIPFMSHSICAYWVLVISQRCVNITSIHCTTPDRNPVPIGSPCLSLIYSLPLWISQLGAFHTVDTYNTHIIFFLRKSFILRVKVFSLHVCMFTTCM